MITGVVFDLDGVLVTTDELHYQGWKRVADEEGIYFDREINHRLRGVSRMESLEILLERATRVFPPEEKQAMAERKNGYYRALLATLTPADVLPGAVEMLAALRARGIKTAIGSSSKNAPLILERVGMTDAVEVVVDGNHITHSKPDPEVFLLAAARLGLPPAACLVVEDAAAGIEAGRRAGMAVLGIGTPATLPGVVSLVAGLADITPDELLAITPDAVSTAV